MNLSPAPKTPIRSPQPGSTSKTLQLTPIWEEVVKNNRLPPDINQDLIFKEISLRLEDLEWPVRQHAFRVLYDIIPVISNDRLDERIIQNNILSKLVINLGHPAPGIRKVASETIQKYFKESSQSEKMLEDFLQYGIKEKNLVNTDQAGILRENITLGTIISLVDILKPFVVPENGGYSISQSFLTRIVEALASQVKNPLYREKCLESLWKLSEMVGEARFYQTLENVPEKAFLINMMRGRGEKEDFPEKMTKSNEDNSWSDETKSENSYGVAPFVDSDSFDLDTQGIYRQTERDGLDKGDSSEEYTDGTDTETYTKEPAPNDLEVPDGYYNGDMNYASPSFVPIDKDFDQRADKKEERNDRGSPRVVLEAEFQFAKNKAITMTVVEDEKESEDMDKIDVYERRFSTDDGDVIMKVHESVEDGRTRTPRRVRFGGEVIKLRTPDSDTTDITIEIHETDDEGGKKEPIRELIKIPTEKKEEKVEEKDSPSLIPLPVVPATKPPTREASPARKPEPPKEACLSPKDSFDSAPSSSGSETEMKDKWSDDDVVSWHWEELRLVEENIMKDLKNKENWKIQYQALEQLKVVLINPKTIERIGKVKNREMLNSLFKCLLQKLPQTNNQQVTALALSIVSQLIETLPKDVIVLYVEDIVQGLCRYVGGCKNLSLKVESVQSLKMLFGILEPSSVIDVLLGDACLFSSSSKLRENSLLAIMYATMTFPSDVFDVDKILEKVTDSTADVRRRVRHAALEAIAILSQFCSSKTLADNIARVAETLSTTTARGQLVAAVQARLSRRLLPTVSNEGLVLYALQIPASRRFGHLGNPMGADVDWILSGTGSVSTGSAKSKSQLNAVQRLDLKPTTPLSPNKWAQSDRKLSSPVKVHPKEGNKTGNGENPWTIQKHRTESSMVQNAEIPKVGGGRFYKTQSAGNLIGGTSGDMKAKVNENKAAQEPEVNVQQNMTEPEILRPEDITWALIPISALEEPHLGRERSNSLWGESVGENHAHYLSPSLSLRPLYLKLQPGQEQFILSRSSDDVRRSSYSHGNRKGSERFTQEDFTEIRLLTPTILRDKNASDSNHQNGKVPKNESRGTGDNTTRIPVLSSNLKNNQKPSRSSTTYTTDRDRKVTEADDSPLPSKPIKLNNITNSYNGSPAFLPNIHAGQPDANYNLQKTSAQNKYGDVDEVKLQDTMTQLSGLLTTSKGISKPGNRDFYPIKPPPAEIEIISTGNDMIEKFDEPEILSENKNKMFDRGYVKNHGNLPNSVSSAPAVITSEGRDQTPSTSSSNSTDFGTLSGSEMRLRRLTNGSGALDVEGGLPFRNYNTYNPKLKSKRISTSKNSGKIGINGTPFPDTLKPFDRPKEGLDTCFNQLESQQWEVNMLGLTSLVRLLRHHPAIALSQLHPIIVALGKQIKNLRSQVSRAACQVSAEMFTILKRNVEPDLDELSGHLFHRSADTNRFIRADCNHALDNMVDNVGHAKAVSVIISKGTTHQNATVRTVAARLLLRLSEKVGAEKLLSLPKESREKMLQAGANLLMEGKLETRAFAKQIFRVWSSHPSFSNLILEAVQPNVMRNISKTLISLKS